MFPLQRGNELANSLHHHRAQHKISEDLIILDDYDSLVVDFSHKKLSSGTSRRPKKILYGADTSGNSNSDEYKKKMVHREIEKQRRQEMATLHASLRSLLPLDFIKGKRSLSDQMNEAVNYINHLQKSIKELSNKRDELKKVSNDMIPNLENHAYSSSFTIHQNNNNNGAVGIEITSGSGFSEEGLPLSKLLQLLRKEGQLEVVSCLSTKVNGRLLHSVQCEVKNSDSTVDLSELRRKFSNMIPSFRCSD